MLSFILFLWFALRVHETCLIVRQIQRCHLMLFADTFCGSVFPAFVLAFLFAHNVVMFQYNASGFCSHVVLSGSHAGLSWDCSLCLAMLFVIHSFGRAQRLIKQGMCRIQRCQFFRLPTSFADLIFAMICFRRQFPLCANISKDISKTQDKLLKHLKDTDQTSYMSKTQNKLLKHLKTQNKHLKHLKMCNKGISHVYLMMKLTF